MLCKLDQKLAAFWLEKFKNLRKLLLQDVGKSTVWAELEKGASCLL